ncbi:hypothetical protein R0J87_16400 [Halomonas sp. SIMBA_159]
MNFQAGADIIFLFLDSPSIEVESFYCDSENVYLFQAYGDYWKNSRPENLNERQKININLANFILFSHDFDGLLFHLDSDEVLYFECDTEALKHKEYVILEPLEVMPSVKKQARKSACFFKEKLPKEKINLLCDLGCLKGEDNQSYFNGHTVGKSGIKPNLMCTLGIHHAKYDAEVKPSKIQGAYLLHYENPSLEEFLSKWSEPSYNDGKSTANVREKRKRFFTSVRLISANDSLSKDEKVKFLKHLYYKEYLTPAIAANELGYLKKVTFIDGHKSCEVSRIDKASEIFDFFVGKDKGAFNAHKTAERKRLYEEVKCLLA